MHLNKPLVSIIVPVFNTEEYLLECLKSIQQQTYSNFEVLLINDGSTDNSKEICQDFGVTDSRFKLYSQTNAGLSAVRNKGIELSQGEYILFVDSDDLISQHLLENAVNILLKNNVDLVLFSYYVVNSGVNEQPVYENPSLGVVSSCIALNNLFMGKFGSYVWSLLAKKSLYVESSISFPVNRQYEDVATTYKIFGSANKIYITSTKLYFYQQRESSITHIHNDKDLDDMLLTIHELNLFITEYYPQLEQIVMNYEFNLVFMLLIRMGGWEANFKNLFLPLSKEKKKYIRKSKIVLKSIYEKTDPKTIYKKKQRLKLMLLNFGLFPLSVTLKNYINKRKKIGK